MFPALSFWEAMAASRAAAAAASASFAAASLLAASAAAASAALAAAAARSAFLFSSRAARSSGLMFFSSSARALAAAQFSISHSISLVRSSNLLHIWKIFWAAFFFSEIFGPASLATCLPLKYDWIAWAALMIIAFFA